MNAHELADILDDIAFLLELTDDNPFRIRTFANASHTLQTLETNFREFVQDVLDGKVKGFGKTLEHIVLEYKETGRVSLLNELQAKVPDGIFEMLNISGLGSKKVKTLYKDNNIRNLDELEEACKNHVVQQISGFGEKSEGKILKSIKFLKEQKDKYLLLRAWEDANILLESLETLRNSPHVNISNITIAGELRRYVEAVRSIDILVSCDVPRYVIDYFSSLACIECHQVTETSIQARLKTTTQKASWQKISIPVSLNVTNENNYPLELVRLTGSQKHFLKLEELANQKGLSIFTDHLTSNKNLNNTHGIMSEQDLYHLLELSYIPPELRESIDEIELAKELYKQNKTFSSLVENKDIKGILHVHTTYSDGMHTLSQMAHAAKELGFDYIGISDHSKSAHYAGGLSLEAIKQQHKEIDTLNRELRPFRIFKGIESDILADGSLDYDDNTLSKFDFVIASIHSRFEMGQEEMTARIIAAIKNPFTTILGHMTGRMLLTREPYDLDTDAILSTAAAHNVAIEINANPRRLDIDWRLHQKAKSLGILLPICPDAHSIDGIADIQWGVAIARKGRLTPKDIPTCWSLDDMINNFMRSESGKYHE